MPGHILRAECRCGFERELAPGFSTVSFVGYKVAYNADGSDLLTEDDAPSSPWDFERFKTPSSRIMSREIRSKKSPPKSTSRISRKAHTPVRDAKQSA